jgi:hypothetical protein
MSLSHTDSRCKTMQLVDRWAARLKIADICAASRPDLSWVARQAQFFSVPFPMSAPFSF